MLDSSAPDVPAHTGLLSRLRSVAGSGVMPFVLSLGLVATVLVAVGVPRVLADPPDAWRLLLVVSLCLLADLPLLRTRFGANVEAFTFAEMCVVIGLVLVPVPTLVVLSTGAVLVFHLLHGITFLKSAFNAASFCIGVALAGTVLQLFGRGYGTDYDLGAAAALLVAALVFFAWNSVAVATVVALAQQVPFAEVYAQGVWMRTLVCVGNAVVGLGVVSLASLSTRALIGLPPLLVVMYVVYRGYLQAMQERDVWQQLESAARELNRLDETEVACAAVNRACQLFKADWVELDLHADLERSAPAVRYSGTAGGMDADVEVTAQVRRAGELPDTPGQMSYARPLEGPHGTFGVLRVCFNGSVQLTKRERHVLRAFTYSVASTMQNARMYGQMRRHAEAKAYEAAHDSLTGLGNRSLLHDRVGGAFARTTQPGQSCALLIVDLDHFKEINDTLGHAAGDVFLSHVGARIAAAVPQADAVCRLGGDEFAVLLGGLDDVAAADGLAAELLEVLAEPVVFDGLRLSIEGSVGVACYPQDASQFEELLQRADIALYQAKESRGSFSHYSLDRDASSVDRLSLAAELRTALRADQLVVHFQPQIDLHTGAVVAAEALVRWRHPRRGLLTPGAFIGAVEHSGLVRDFTLVVLEKAVAECAAWTAAGRPVSVAVNLSARNLLDRQLPFDVGAVLLRHGLPADQLVLEITETTMMSELDVVEVVLAQLRAMGVQLSVDDFGTGFSSLAFLQRVAVNEVKIDRSFVLGMLDSDSDAALVRTTVQLAHSLGARAVAEGVENAELAAALRALGCDYAQGYHLGRPVDAEAAWAVILRRPAPIVPSARSGSDSRRLRAVAGQSDGEGAVAVRR